MRNTIRALFSPWASRISLPIYPSCLFVAISRLPWTSWQRCSVQWMRVANLTKVS